MSTQPEAALAPGTAPDPNSASVVMNTQPTATPETEPEPLPQHGQLSSASTPVEPAAAPVPEKKVTLQTPPASSLSQLFIELPSILRDAGYQEMWGVELKDESHVPSSIVLEKFLRANVKDVGKAKAQLTEALRWRKHTQPMKLLEDEEFDLAKFGGLGYVTTYPKAGGNGKEIVTWNIYGAVKDNKVTFGNVEEFIKWRSALMELSVKELGLNSAKEKIPEDGPDPYRMVQVHDYLDVSFLRMDPKVKAASKEVINTFGMAYPELLKEKFFVNVPLLMGWVFTAMKLFLSPETVKKFHPLSYGSSLAGELPGFGKELPVAYGGKGKDVKDGLTVKYAKPIPVTDGAATESEPKPKDVEPVAV